MKPSQVNVLLVDLDGTLLQVDLNELIPTYINMLGSYFSHLMEPEVLAKALYATTRATVDNRDPQRTNEEVFFEEFTLRTNFTEEKFRPLLEKFYKEEYPRLQSLTSPHPYAPALLETTMQKNLDIVLATNPIFPRVAIEERLRWAKLDTYPLKLITSIENMHYCKPHPEYYEEITQLISSDPFYCIMAGNDVNEDLSAAQAGMATYLVEDNVVNLDQQVPDNTRRGYLQDLVDFVGNL